MIFFDILVYLAVAKIAVLLLEDASYAVRGKQSPRRQARARQQAAAQKATTDGPAGASAPAGAGRTGSGSTVAAANGYFAGLIEDATERSRARRRRAAARKRGTQAVDGVVVDVDEDSRWYADCDHCGWASRPYRIEANALAAGREHTRTEHPEQYTGEPDDPQGSGAGGDSAESAADGADEQTPRRPVLRVIPGGAQEPTPPASQQPAAAPQSVASAPVPPTPNLTTKEWPQRFHHTKCDRCGNTSVTHEMPRHCPRCSADDSRLREIPDPAPAPEIPTFRWRCPKCDATETGFATRPAADAAAAKHTCAARDVPTYYWRCPKCRAYGSRPASKAGAEAAGAQHTCVTATETPAPTTPTDTPAPTTPTTQADRERLRTELYGKCAYREVREGHPDKWCDNPVDGQDPYCADHRQAATPEPTNEASAAPAATTPTAETNQPVEQHYTRCTACGLVNGPTQMWPFHCPRCGAGDDQLHPANDLAGDIEGIREGFERCSSCGKDLDAHDIVVGPFGRPLAMCRPEGADDDQGMGTRPSPMTNSYTDLKELTVNLEATGPDEIRAAFTEAAGAAVGQAEELGGIAGVLSEAADRYESLEMNAATVEHLRAAAEQFAAAAAALNTAHEELMTALVEFNNSDGRVAEVVADTGGNVASKEVLVG
ncbi:hypothetical protein ONO23_05523 [Micromonospora noduli]|uniref:hypothetical protein n=1 Tax=Micromonospora noduli TaxID=709876 RepID=UPI000DBF7C35|nr:hypothetical protein [Micromonospora noduli]RAO26120.1 hypothetical protein ONO23_05523 [Micromonospora noduli]